MTARSLCLIALAALAAPPAQAITCSFISTTAVSFGAYDVFDTSSVDAAGSLTLNCESVLPEDNITVTLDGGGASSWAPREMTKGVDVLDYNIYTDAARTTVWGDGTSGSGKYGPANPPDGTNFTLTTYGRLPALQDIPSGSYADTIVATVNY